jgi:hypothetical protein
MAVLQQPGIGGGNPFAERIGDDLAPVGTWMATVVDVCDEFGVVRSKYQKPEEMETVDLATFLFGFRDMAGNPHMVASKRMKISGNEKSALYAFLKSMLGCAPKYGWDYVALRGTTYLLTVEHLTRKDGAGVFAAIASLSPIPKGMAVAPAAVPSPAQPVAPAARPAPVVAGGHALGDPVPF